MYQARQGMMYGYNQNITMQRPVQAMQQQYYQNPINTNNGIYQLQPQNTLLPNNFNKNNVYNKNKENQTISNQQCNQSFANNEKKKYIQSSNNSSGKKSAPSSHHLDLNQIQQTISDHQSKQLQQYQHYKQQAKQNQAPKLKINTQIDTEINNLSNPNVQNLQRTPNKITKDQSYQNFKYSPNINAHINNIQITPKSSRPVYTTNTAATTNNSGNINTKVNNNNNKAFNLSISPQMTPSNQHQLQQQQQQNPLKRSDILQQNIQVQSSIVINNDIQKNDKSAAKHLKDRDTSLSKMNPKHQLQIQIDSNENVKPFKQVLPLSPLQSSHSTPKTTHHTQSQLLNVSIQQQQQQQYQHLLQFQQQQQQKVIPVYPQTNNNSNNTNNQINKQNNLHNQQTKDGKYFFHNQNQQTAKSNNPSLHSHTQKCQNNPNSQNQLYKQYQDLQERNIKTTTNNNNNYINLQIEAYDNSTIEMIEQQKNDLFCSFAQKGEIISNQEDQKPEKNIQFHYEQKQNKPENMCETTNQNTNYNTQNSSYQSHQQITFQGNINEQIDYLETDYQNCINDNFQENLINYQSSNLLESNQNYIIEQQQQQQQQQYLQNLSTKQTFKNNFIKYPLDFQDQQNFQSLQQHSPQFCSINNSNEKRNNQINLIKSKVNIVEKYAENEEKLLYCPEPQEKQETQQEQEEIIAPIDKNNELDYSSLNLKLDFLTLSKQIQYNQPEFQFQGLISIDMNEIHNKENFLKNQSLDLIFVLDRSGSMAGQKIKSLIACLQTIISQLQNNDRICLIQYDHEAEIICPLIKISESNQQIFQNSLNQIIEKGLTNIAQGVQNAFSILKNRKQINNQTSIILLCDGVDDEADQRIEQQIHSDPILQSQNFNFHCFGYGNDSDCIVLNKISKLKEGGSYTYVNQPENLYAEMSQKIQQIRNQTGYKFQLDLKIQNPKFTFIQNNENTFSSQQQIFDEGKHLQLIFSEKQIKLNNIYKQNVSFHCQIQNKSAEQEQQLQEEGPDDATVLCNLYLNIFKQYNDKNQDAQSKQQSQIVKEQTISIKLINNLENQEQELEFDNQEMLLFLLQQKAIEKVNQSLELALRKEYQKAQLLLAKFIESQIQTNKDIDKDLIKNLSNKLNKAYEYCSLQQFKKSVGHHELLNIIYSLFQND